MIQSITIALLSGCSLMSALLIRNQSRKIRELQKEMTRQKFWTTMADRHVKVVTANSKDVLNESVRLQKITKDLHEVAHKILDRFK